jgi:hypothetical protein
MQAPASQMKAFTHWSLLVQPASGACTPHMPAMQPSAVGQSERCMHEPAPPDEPLPEDPLPDEEDAPEVGEPLPELATAVSAVVAPDDEWDWPASTEPPSVAPCDGFWGDEHDPKAASSRRTASLGSSERGMERPPGQADHRLRVGERRRTLAAIWSLAKRSPSLRPESR